MPTPEELEDAAAADAVRTLKARLEEITRKGLSLYESMDVSNSAAQSMVARLLADQLDHLADTDVPENVALLIEESATEAFRIGRSDAARLLAVADPADLIPDRNAARLDAHAVAVRKELRDGARQMRQAESATDVLSAFSSSRRAVTRTEANARFAVNESLSEGTKAVTEDYQVSRLWVPERDACVHCLAYAGEVAGPGEDFRGGLTFGAKPLVPASASVGGPPLHPNCRCRIVPYRADLEADSGKVEAYKREALRSVLRGFSLPSESERVRLDAAQRALKSASLMPKSVQDYARASVKRGSFSRGRAFPDQKQSALTARDKLDLTPAKDAPNGLASLPTRVVGSIGDERRDSLSKVNPRFGEPGYGINCVHVVAAAELRRRGYDVEATALPTALWGNRGRNLDEALGRWREPDVWQKFGEDVPEGTPGAHRITRATRRMEPVPMVGGLQTNTLAIVKSWGPGARGWISLGWKRGGAHVFSAEVARDGKTVILTDSQTGKVINARGYFIRADAARVARVDDLVPSDGVMEFVRPSGSPV